MKSKWLLSVLSTLLMLAGCENEPVVVGNNTQALEISKVDILLVVDDSNSMADLQAQLPELLDSFVAGSDEPGQERPELNDIHLAVVTTDLGVGSTSGPVTVENCVGLGNDGRFIELTAEDIAQCSPEMDAFIKYKDGHGEITTEVAASCVPDVGTAGCGFEQPLEAMLKALWPASDDTIQFLDGEGHGEDANDGFLRDDSLLVVIVVSDEDDCSTWNPSIFDPSRVAGTGKGLNAICYTSEDDLYEIERYVGGLRALRPAEDDPIVFATISGVPRELAEQQTELDLGDAEAVAEYYESVLDAPEMQHVLDSRGNADWADDHVFPSCDRGEDKRAYPPRRLVQLAQAFGSAGVVGSVCGDDFASAMGSVIRATAEKL